MIAEARQRPASSRFLLPDTFSFLSTAALKHPIVIFIATSSTAFAILIKQRDIVQTVALPGLNKGRLEQYVFEMSKKSEQGRAFTSQRLTKVVNPTKKFGSFEHLLCLLWDTIMSGVISAFNWQVCTCPWFRPNDEAYPRIERQHGRDSSACLMPNRALRSSAHSCCNTTQKKKWAWRLDS